MRINKTVTQSKYKSCIYNNIGVYINIRITTLDEKRIKKKSYGSKKRTEKYNTSDCTQLLQKHNKKAFVNSIYKGKNTEILE